MSRVIFGWSDNMFWATIVIVVAAIGMSLAVWMDPIRYFYYYPWRHFKGPATEAALRASLLEAMEKGKQLRLLRREYSLLPHRAANELRRRELEAEIARIDSRILDDPHGFLRTLFRAAENLAFDEARSIEYREQRELRKRLLSAQFVLARVEVELRGCQTLQINERRIVKYEEEFFLLILQQVHEFEPDELDEQRFQFLAACVGLRVFDGDTDRQRFYTSLGIPGMTEMDLLSFNKGFGRLEQGELDFLVSRGY